MEQRRYKIEVTEEQAELIEQALDLYSRIGCGQFGEIAYHFDHFRKNVNEPTYDVGRKIRSNLQFLLPSNFSPCMAYGIGSHEISKKTKQSYEVMCVIRHRIAWTRNPKGNSMSVAFDDPAKFRITNSSLPKMELIKQESKSKSESK